jgi:hypothetical protein
MKSLREFLEWGSEWDRRVLSPRVLAVLMGLLAVAFVAATLDALFKGQVLGVIVYGGLAALAVRRMIETGLLGRRRT